MTGADPAPPSRDTVPRTVGVWAAPLAVMALVALVLVVAFARQDEGPLPGVQVGVPERPRPEISSFVVESEIPVPGIIGRGTARDGEAWMLAIGDPSAGLCLTVGIEASDGEHTTCVPITASSPELSPDAHQPAPHGDVRLPRSVFGRMPPDVTEVEVIVADGGSLGRVFTLPGGGGPFYAVEVTGEPAPIAVIGYRRTGTAVRYDLPR